MACVFLAENLFLLLQLEKDFRLRDTTDVVSHVQLFHFNVIPEFITNYWN